MKYLHIYPNCIPVRGASRSIIYDLQRCLYHFIPNSLFEILCKTKKRSIEEVKIDYEEEDQLTVDEYVSFIVKEGYGFLGDQNESLLFPEFDTTYYHPSIISNAIIDVDADTTHDFEHIFLQLEDLGCKDVQIRFFSQYSLEKIIAIISLLNKMRIRSVELLIQHNDETTEENLKSLCRNHVKVVHLIIANAPEKKRVHAGVTKHTYMVYTSDSITAPTCCGNINSSYFSVNVPLFTEAKSHNSCLNRKMSIDTKGNIKNCPSMVNSYGHILDTTLKEVVKKPAFKKLWEINKDQIDTCMDCEFRYMCTDCRAYIEDSADILSKPSKCNYDPYTATWKTA